MDNELMNGVPEEEEATVKNTPETPEEEIIADSAEETIAEENEEAATEDNEETVSEEESPAEESEEESDSESLCIICGENEKEDDSDYCAECTAAMYKRKIPFLAWVSGLAVLVMSVFAFVLTALISAPALQAARGDTYAAKNCWYPAYVEYSKVSGVVNELTDIFGQETPFIKAGKSIDGKMIESYAKCRSPLDAVYMATMMYGESQVEKIPYVKKYVDIYNDFYQNYSLMGETLENMMGDATKEETFAALEGFKGVEGINEVYRNYFLFNAADYYKLGADEELKYVEAADAAAKEQGEDYAWLYYIEIADILCSEDKYEQAVKYVDGLVERDKSNYRASSLKMRLAFAMGDEQKAAQTLADFKTDNKDYDSAIALEAAYLRMTGDLEKSKLLCEEGFVEYDSSPELHRQLALVYLCEGDYANAYEQAFIADSNAAYIANYYMDSSNYTPQHDSTLYLCTMICKNKNIKTTENAAYIDQIVEYYTGYEPTHQVSSILSGEKTAQQVLTEGVCDLA